MQFHAVCFLIIYQTLESLVIFLGMVLLILTIKIFKFIFNIHSLCHLDRLLRNTNYVVINISLFSRVRDRKHKMFTSFCSSKTSAWFSRVRELNFLKYNLFPH